MKKTVSFIASAALILSVASMSGCSDFGFNPLGTWELDNSIYGDEGIVIYYVFEKSGTGYMTFNDEQLDSSFTYTYDDDNVYISYISLTTGDVQSEASFEIIDNNTLREVENVDYTYEETSDTVTLETTYTLTRA